MPSSWLTWVRKHSRNNCEGLPRLPLTPLVYAYGAHRTHTEEFYEVTESSFDLSELKDELLEWEQVYNTVRPHQALGYVTPLKFLEQRKEYSGKEDVSLII